MLECARALAGSHSPIPALGFVAFNAEEDGLLGSRDFVTNGLPALRGPVRSAHVLEMVGFRGGRGQAQDLPASVASREPRGPGLPRSRREGIIQHAGGRRARLRGLTGAAARGREDLGTSPPSPPGSDARRSLALLEGRRPGGPLDRHRELSGSALSPRDRHAGHTRLPVHARGWAALLCAVVLQEVKKMTVVANREETRRNSRGASRSEQEISFATSCDVACRARKGIDCSRAIRWRR